MIDKKELYPLIRLCWSEENIGFPMKKADYYDENKLKIKKKELKKEGYVIKSLDEETEYINCGFLVPFSTVEDDELSWQEQQELIQKEGMTIRENLFNEHGNSLKYRNHTGFWMVADAYVEEVIISSDAREMDIILQGVLDYLDDKIKVFKVTMHLKEVQQYEIHKINKGMVTLIDDQEKRLNRRYNMVGGAIQDDFYEIYHDGYFTMIILIPAINGWAIQVDYKNIVVEKEVTGGDKLFWSE